MRRGLHQVVPPAALSLLTWNELELLVCGDPQVDVAQLRRHTVVEGGLSLSHPVVRALFKALHSFSAHERQMFVR